MIALDCFISSERIHSLSRNVSDTSTVTASAALASRINSTPLFPDNDDDDNDDDFRQHQVTQSCSHPSKELAEQVNLGSHGKYDGDGLADG